jgi:LysM repeat protein
MVRMYLSSSHRYLIGVIVLLLFGLTGCFKDAADSNSAPTQQQVNVLAIEQAQTPTNAPLPSATATINIATFTPSTPTISKTDVIGGPPVEDAETSDETEEADAPPTATRTQRPSETPVPPDVATVAPPGFSDTGISPTPSLTHTPSLVPGLPTPTPLEDEDECVYLVQGGDTLFSIARDFDFDPEDFVAINPELAANPDSLYIGQELQIPECIPEEDDDDVDSTPTTRTATSPPTGIQTYIIQQDDTLYSIALQFGVTVAEIVAANDSLVSENTLIYPGDTLLIPESE